MLTGIKNTGEHIERTHPSVECIKSIKRFLDRQTQVIM